MLQRLVLSPEDARPSWPLDDTQTCPGRTESNRRLPHLGEIAFRLSSNWCPCRELKPAIRFTRAAHRLNASGANFMGHDFRRRSAPQRWPHAFARAQSGLGAGLRNRTPERAAYKTAGAPRALVQHEEQFFDPLETSPLGPAGVLPVKSSCRDARTRRRSASSSRQRQGGDFGWFLSAFTGRGRTLGRLFRYLKPLGLHGDDEGGARIPQPIARFW